MFLKYTSLTHPAIAGKDRRPIVEFAVENAQTMKKREQREKGKKGAFRLRKLFSGRTRTACNQYANLS